VTTQAPPLRQSKDTFGGISGNITLKIFVRNTFITISVTLSTACKINEDVVEDVSIVFLA
jgi:hypothetical protein